MSITADKLVNDTVWDHYTYAYDYDGGGNLIYLGRAPIGSTKDLASWQIVQFTYSGANVTDKQWANKGSFNNIWDDRTLLTYS
jgi:hypothetical protein